MARSTKAQTSMVLALLIIAGAASAFSLFAGSEEDAGRTGMAVEFMDHAAAAYVAQDKGWYEERGLLLSSYTSYATGMALASALSRRDVQVAYMCLVPAISAHANARVPLKIVAGTHLYGYALVVDPQVVSGVADLTREDVRLGCVRQGGSVDVLMNKTIEKYKLAPQQILDRVRRMNPSKMLLALKSHQLDAAFLPEQWASMAEDLGFVMLLKAQDVWPGMPGSVLVVKEELIRENPDMVRELVAVNQKATRWINAHPEQAAHTLARVLSLTPLSSHQEMSPETLLRSMKRLEYTTHLDPEAVQEIIDYTARLGYIKKSFPAAEIMDMGFCP